MFKHVPSHSLIAWLVCLAPKCLSFSTLSHLPAQLNVFNLMSSQRMFSKMLIVFVPILSDSSTSAPASDGKLPLNVQSHNRLTAVQRFGDQAAHSWLIAPMAAQTTE